MFLLVKVTSVTHSNQISPIRFLFLKTSATALCGCGTPGILCIFCISLGIFTDCLRNFLNLELLEKEIQFISFTSRQFCQSNTWQCFKYSGFSSKQLVMPAWGDMGEVGKKTMDFFSESAGVCTALATAGTATAVGTGGTSLAPTLVCSAVAVGANFVSDQINKASRANPRAWMMSWTKSKRPVGKLPKALQAWKKRWTKISID